MKKILLILLVLLFPITLAAQDKAADLGLSQTDILFSVARDQLVKDQPVQIYAKIHNHGQRDATGQVVFYSNDVQIGEAQPVSVRAGGLADEVFVDWIVPAESFEVKVVITNINPSDEKPANNQAKTGLINPLAEPVETEAEPEVPETSEPEKPADFDIPETDGMEVVRGFQVDGKFIYSIAIKSQKLGWGHYDFTFVTNEPDFDVSQIEFEWDYGDGKISTVNGEHKYVDAGTYHVKLSLKGPFSNTLTDVTTIYVPFWSGYNIGLWSLIVLVGLISFGLWYMWKMKFRAMWHDIMGKNKEEK
jgi:hypothetical protein